MKCWLFVLVLALCVPSAVHSQSVIDRLKEKAKNRADQRLDEGVEKGLDKAEEKIKENKSRSASGVEKSDGQAETPNSNIAAGSAAAFKSYSRYDFVPGVNIVYAEDFSQDVIGEFPLKWATNNRGEVVTIEGSNAKWFRLFQEGNYVSPELKKLPENFTLEFDMILKFDQGGDSYLLPEVAFKLLQLPTSDAQAKEYLLQKEAPMEVLLTISPGDGNSTISLTSMRDGNVSFQINEKELKRLDSYYGKPVHFALWVQKERLRLWINDEKVFDIPHAVPSQSSFNHVDFAVSSSNYQEEQIGVYVGNLKVAEGSADSRSKLLTEGRLVTNGILFDVNSDVVKPQSAGVLREIAAVLKENTSLKVRIIGHTDSDGEESKNLDLSRRRAASVKSVLTKEYGIAADRMESNGMGESKPVADNKTSEGKAQNRRVEFIKL